LNDKEPLNGQCICFEPGGGQGLTMNTKGEESAARVEPMVGQPSGDLRLYVVGDASGDPDKWSVWGGWGLVFATSPEEAITLADKHEYMTGNIATAVKPVAPTAVYRHDVSGY
jgi:hypothetical protein